jgi:hypothetical protein
LIEAQPSSAGRYQNVLELERRGKARLETLTALATKSGQRAVVEACDEVRYPTAFAPGKTRDDYPTPTEFDMRRAGDMLEIEPAFDQDGVHCSLNLVPQRISLAGFRDVPGMSDDPPAAQPLFVTQKLTTSAMLAIDQVHFLGTLSPPAGNVPVNWRSAPEIWLAFLHVHHVLAAAESKEMKSRSRAGLTIDMEYSIYSVDRDAARDLLASFPSLDASWERLQGLLREDKARFEDFLSIKSMPGQRSVSQGANESRFGTAYALPGMRRSRETTTRTIPASGKDGKPPAQNSTPPNVQTTTVENETPTSDPTPGAYTAFETRNTGLSVEEEAAVGPDGSLVDVNTVVKNETDRGNLETTGAAAHFPAQPVFETRTIATSIATIVGSHALVGTLSMPGSNGVNGRVDDGRTWLVFVRVMSGDR